MKFPRTYHIPGSPGATNDDKIAVNINNIYNEPIIITEKLDGENNKLTTQNVFSRNHIESTHNPWCSRLKQIHAQIGYLIPKDTYVYVENMQAIHSIQYDTLTSYTYIHSILKDNIWLSWNEITEYARILTIPTVPVLYTGIIKNEKELYPIIKDLTKSPSLYGNIREGIVVRPARQYTSHADNVFKWVRANHIQTDKNWAKNWKEHKLF